MATLTRYGGAELLLLPDCAELRENGRCGLHGRALCVGAECADYGRMKNRERARARLRSLDEGTQERISCKYYGGTRPWTEAAAKPRR